MNNPKATHSLLVPQVLLQWASHAASTLLLRLSRITLPADGLLAPNTMSLHSPTLSLEGDIYVCHVSAPIQVQEELRVRLSCPAPHTHPINDKTIIMGSMVQCCDMPFWEVLLEANPELGEAVKQLIAVRCITQCWV